MTLETTQARMRAALAGLGTCAMMVGAAIATTNVVLGALAMLGLAVASWYIGSIPLASHDPEEMTEAQRVNLFNRWYHGVGGKSKRSLEMAVAVWWYLARGEHEAVLQAAQALSDAQADRKAPGPPVVQVAEEADQ